MTKDEFNTVTNAHKFGLKTVFADIFKDDGYLGRFKVRAGCGMFGWSDPHLEFWKVGDSKNKKYVASSSLTVHTDDPGLGLRLDYKRGESMCRMVIVNP